MFGRRAFSGTLKQVERAVPRGHSSTVIAMYIPDLSVGDI